MAETSLHKAFVKKVDKKTLKRIEELNLLDEDKKRTLFDLIELTSGMLKPGSPINEKKPCIRCKASK